MLLLCGDSSAESGVLREEGKIEEVTGGMENRMLTSPFLGDKVMWGKSTEHSPVGRAGMPPL